MPTALLSVSDKNGLPEFAQALIATEWELIASGGTARSLTEAGLKVTDVSELTGAPEMLAGRVKTLHPAIHAGILARPTAEDRAELKMHGLAEIDMVVCNLYPFQQTSARSDVSLDEAIEQIDIGGVALLRAAAKNFARVIVICDPTDYLPVAGVLQKGRTLPTGYRAELAAKAFSHTAQYDSAITGYLSGQAERLSKSRS